MKVLPLFGLFVQDRIKKENTLLLARIADLETRMSEFQYCGVWHVGAYKRGNFVSHDGSVWHCNVDTCEKHRHRCERVDACGQARKGRAMTVDKCMAKATAAIDEAIAAAMDQGIKLIYDRGATEEEERYGEKAGDLDQTSLYLLYIKLFIRRCQKAPQKTLTGA